MDGYGGGRVAIDPNNSQTVYAVSMLVGTNAVLRKSINGGTSWTTVLNIGSSDRAAGSRHRQLGAAAGGRHHRDGVVEWRGHLDKPQAQVGPIRA